MFLGLILIMIFIIFILPFLLFFVFKNEHDVYVYFGCFQFFISIYLILILMHTVLSNYEKKYYYSCIFIISLFFIIYNIIVPGLLIFTDNFLKCDINIHNECYYYIICSAMCIGIIPGILLLYSICKLCNFLLNNVIDFYLKCK